MREVEGVYTVQKVRIGVALPLRLNASEELPPGFMIFFRIELVSL